MDSIKRTEMLFCGAQAEIQSLIFINLFFCVAIVGIIIFLASSRKPLKSFHVSYIGSWVVLFSSLSLSIFSLYWLVGKIQEISVAIARHNEWDTLIDMINYLFFRGLFIGAATIVSLAGGCFLNLRTTKKMVAD
ncbi:MAG: hypothetical protein WC459_02480 [Patescibacteria group bacterium]